MVNIDWKILDSSKQQKSKRCPSDLANLIKILTPKQMLQRLPTQQTFQRCFNVFFWLTRRRDVGQRQINIETTLCISTLKSTMSNNVESMLCISTLTWTALGNVETTLLFSTSSFTMLVNVETTLWKWPLLKKTKNTRKNSNRKNSNRIPGIQNFSYHFIIFTCSPC